MRANATGWSSFAAKYGPGAFPALNVKDGTQLTTVNDPDPSISVVWDRAAQLAVIETGSPTGPTVASRAYALVHTAMSDAWASDDPTAVRVSFEASRSEATAAPRRRSGSTPPPT